MGRFTAVSAGVRACGVRASGAIECWGFSVRPSYDIGRSNAPQDRSTAVTAGQIHACNIRGTDANECRELENDDYDEAPPFLVGF